MTTPRSRGPTETQYNSPTGEDGPLPWADPQPDPLTAEEMARAVDALNFALVAASVPEQFRAYIDALVGASLGCQDWFEAADIEVGQRARQVSTIGLKDKSIEKWTQREREEFTEWQEARGITLIEAMPGGKKDGVSYKTRYRLANLFRLAIETDRRARLRPGFDRNPKRELRKAAEVVYAELRAGRQEPAKRQRFRRPRRTCDTYVKIINTALEKLSGQALIEHKDLGALLEPILLNIKEKCELLNNSLAPLLNQAQVEQTQGDNGGVHVDMHVHSKNGAESGLVHTLPEGKYGQTEPVNPVLVGQPAEEFCAENWPEELDAGPGSWRDEPTSQAQRDLLLKAGEFNIPPTKGEASDRIDEVIKSGALTDFFSLEELKLFDPKAGGERKVERRFACPSPGCGDSKPMDDDHRSLSANVISGKYQCHRCGTAGILREYLGDAGQARTFHYTGPTKQEKSDKWREWVTKAQAISDSAGAKYLEGRGVPVEVAEAAGVKFGQWWKRGDNGPVRFPAVIFSVFDQGGSLVAAQARAIEGATKRTGGDKLQGVFLAAPDVLNSERIAICEAPIDALVLAACGVPGIAILGKTWPEWLPGALVGKDVAMATDADKDGDECAARLSAEITTCATTWRLRPIGAKDWAELAEREGLDAVLECVMNAMERSPEAPR